MDKKTLKKLLEENMREEAKLKRIKLEYDLQFEASEEARKRYEAAFSEFTNELKFILTKEEETLIRSGNLIGTIKLVRQRTTLSLKDAKDFVVSYVEKHKINRGG